MYKSDKKQKDLVDYEAEIGMTKLKEDTRPASGYKKENYYMACSPKWIDYENAENLNKIKDLKKTKFDIQTLWHDSQSLEVKTRNSAEGSHHDNAPSFGDPTDRSNGRWPSYTAWH